jgi:hypothetical protein
MRKISIASILILFLQFFILPAHVVAAEDNQTKVNRLVTNLERSNRLTDAWIASLESLDSIWAAIDDAIEAKDFATLPNLEKRTSDTRKKIAAQNTTLKELIAAEVADCQKPGGWSPSESSVEDACAEFKDAKNAAADAKGEGDEVLAQVESKLAILSKAAAAAAAAKAPAAREPSPKVTPKATPQVTPKTTPRATPKATPKATIKVTIKVVLCRKGSQDKSFKSTSCPPGWVKK